MTDLMEVLANYRNGATGAPPGAVEEHYMQVARQAPPEHVASGLAAAFRSDQTPPFSQMLSTLFSNSDGQQRAGILNRLLGAVGPGLASSGILGGLSSLLGGGQNTVTPEAASRVSPEQVKQLAEHAEKQNPSIVDQAGEFYAQHPTLVQSLGLGAMAMVMSHMYKK